MLGAIKRMISVVIQTFLFWIVNFIGFITEPFKIEHDVALMNARILWWDGILCILIAYGVVLLCGAYWKRLPMMAVESTIALVLAILLGYWSGFDSRGPFVF